jgi:hypothetical protein
MKIKKGVSIKKMSVQIMLALCVASEIYSKYGFELTITSGSDGNHMVGSLHPLGLAVDIRTNGIESKYIKEIAAIISLNLGSEYDVVVEVDHIHIEYDPN